MAHKKYACLALIALILYPVYAFASGCGTYKQNLNTALSAGFIPVFTAHSSPIEIMMVVNKYGDWVIIGIDAKHDACPVAKGSGFNLLIERSL